MVCETSLCLLHSPVPGNPLSNNNVVRFSDIKVATRKLWGIGVNMRISAKQNEGPVKEKMELMEVKDKEEVVEAEGKFEREMQELLNEATILQC